MTGSSHHRSVRKPAADQAAPPSIGGAVRAAAKVLEDAHRANLPEPGSVWVDHYLHPSGDLHLTGHPGDYLRMWAKHFDATIDARPSPRNSSTYATAEFQRYSVPWQVSAFISVKDKPMPSASVPRPRPPEPPKGITFRLPISLRELAWRTAAMLDHAEQDGLPAPASLRLCAYTDRPEAYMYLRTETGETGVTALSAWADSRAGGAVSGEPVGDATGDWRANLEWHHEGVRYVVAARIGDAAPF